MRLKKVMALALAGVMATGLVGCGGSDDEKTTAAQPKETQTQNVEEMTNAAAESHYKKPEGLKGTLTIWTLAGDLETMGKKFMEEFPDVKVDTTVIAPADYATKVGTALEGGDTSIDIIVAEFDGLEAFYDANYFADLSAMGADEFDGEIVDYVWQAGKDSSGVQRAISYQVTPAGFYYRTDIAEEVFGTADPDEIGKHFASYDEILKTGDALKEKGYRLFASDAELGYFTNGDPSWVVDGKLNIDQKRIDYMDLCVDLYKGNYTTFSAQWATPWYMAMAGEVPILTADTQWGTDDIPVWEDPEKSKEENQEAFKKATSGLETAQVFAFGLPTWGALTMRDNAGDTIDKWAICKGPSYGFGGGTWIGISALSENKELAWEFVKWATLCDDTLNWWIEASNGDVVSKKSVLAAHKDDENPNYNGEKTYAFWLGQAEGVDFSQITKYSSAIGKLWGDAIGKVKSGDSTKEEAIEDFKDAVEEAYHGEITVE